MFKEIVAIRGGGDLATAVAHRLHRSGFRIIILELDRPELIRKKVAFAQAIYDKTATVEGVTAVKIENIEGIFNAWEKKLIPVIIDKECSILNRIKVDILIDGILAKKNLGTKIDMAAITIGLGPGFEAGKDVNLVVETNRGHNLGKVIFAGNAEENTGIPGEIMGYSEERVVRSPCSGIINNLLSIGDIVNIGDVIAHINDQPIKANIHGVLRGLINDNMEVEKYAKIGDIDPRSKVEYCYTISDKGRAIAGGVLEGILFSINSKF